MGNYLRKVGIPFVIYAILASGKQAGTIEMGWLAIVLISLLGGGVLQALVFGLWQSNRDREK